MGKKGEEGGRKGRLMKGKFDREGKEERKEGKEVKLLLLSSLL